MGRVEIVRVALIAELTVAPEPFEERLGYSPPHLGDTLAQQVDVAVRERGEHYYPPLKQLQGWPGVDPSLLGLIEEVAWHVCEYVRGEVRRRLGAHFSHVRIDAVEATAYTMPRARPGQPNARVELGRHYAPDTVRVELVASSMVRDIGQGEASDEGMVKLASQKLQRWLKGHFERIELRNARRLGNDEA